jgi:bifunctional ADP-heptose synthase (sugar kinase/adenylyltransferase)
VFILANLLATIIAACRERGIPAIVDPKKADYLRYVGATCVTPNFHEFQEALLTMDTGQHASLFGHEHILAILITWERNI